MNADRKKFLLSAAEDEASVPAGVDDTTPEPQAVSVRHQKIKKLHMTCEWQTCMHVFTNYEHFLNHVEKHCEDSMVIKKDDTVNYACLWDLCNHMTADMNNLIRHLNYHAYHTKLMAVGYNAQATLKLLPCRRDSSKRNYVPLLTHDLSCRWINCDQTFKSIQYFFNHVHLHALHSYQPVCSWAGCGVRLSRRDLLAGHVASHTSERKIACYHCGQQFCNNRRLLDHLKRQNVSSTSSRRCTMCGLVCATEYLLSEHSRLHVSAYACAMCDMIAVNAAALAAHVRYMHLPRTTPPHACTTCDYRAVTTSDLRTHILTHEQKKKKLKSDESSDHSDSDRDFDAMTREKKPARQYACHLCPDNKAKRFAYGKTLTKHLAKKHGAQLPFGYSRFRYKKSKDGLYRLTTTRYEMLDVSEKVVDGHSGPKESIADDLQFTVRQSSEATQCTPARFEVDLKDNSAKDESEQNHVEITIMCDMAGKGNIIKSEVIHYS